ncbi:hypothetical protein JKP88DRAFT_154484, partial [Tribonema minus]
MSHYCYALCNESGRTYVGYTVCPARRIRQHNSDIKGGAKATRGRGPWRFIYVVDCIDYSASDALSLEWHIKHP